MDTVYLVTELATKSKYIFLFILYFVEGPISNFVSSVLASTGALNMSVVFTLVVSAEILGDATYFLLGKYLPRGYVDRKVSEYEKSGLLKEIELAVINHPLLTLTILKVTSLLAVPGLFYMGRKSFLPFDRYMFYAILICFVKNGIISYVGYSLGLQLEEFFQYYNVYVSISIFLLISAIILLIVKAYNQKLNDMLRKVIKKLG